jgi:hypothetical protein
MASASMASSSIINGEMASMWHENESNISNGNKSMAYENENNQSIIKSIMKIIEIMAIINQ